MARFCLAVGVVVTWKVGASWAPLGVRQVLRVMLGQTLVVNYVREKQGMIQEVWLLNQAEADEKRKGMEPITNFIFGSSEDKPKVDDGKTPFNQLPKFPKQ